MKLSELAKELEEIVNEIWETTRKPKKAKRHSTKKVSRKKAKKKSRRALIVQLTTGYEVNVREPEGLIHLCKAILGETATWLNGLKLGFGGIAFWNEVHGACLWELRSVGKQLRSSGSAITEDRLIDEFKAFWDYVAEKFGKDD